MDANSIELVQSSFQKVEPIADQAAAMFYDRLFEIAPDVKSLFTNDMPSQGRMLMAMIGAAVKGLDQLESIVPVVEKLGRNHSGYGVKPEHYQPVAEALLWTLERGLGDEWNEDLAAAWTEAYTLLATTMLEAAGEVAT